MLKFRWLHGACAALALFAAGCASSSSDDPETPADDEPTHALTGVWIGYNKNFSGEGQQDSAGLVGFEVDGTGQIVQVFSYPDWVTLETPSQIDEVTADATYRIEGTNFWEGSNPDAAMFILLGSDLEHIGAFILDDEEDRVEPYALQLDNEALDNPPEAPSGAVSNLDIAGTWSGTAFDVVVGSPPDFNTVEDASVEFITAGESDLRIPPSQLVLGVEVGNSETLLDNSYDAEMGYFLRNTDGYFIGLLPTPDLAGMAFWFCEPTGEGQCGNLEGNALSLDPASEGNGWGFAWLEAE